MKKIILTLAFVSGITSMNANSNINNQISDPEEECHAEACEFIAFAEENGPVNEEVAQQYYDLAFNACMQ